MSRLQVIAVFGVMVMGASACGSSSKPTPPTPPASASASAPAPAPAPVAAPAAPDAAAAPAPPPTCAADADCNFAEGVEPARCVVGPAPAAGKQPAKPDGSCVCLDGGCALRPSRERISQQACNWTLDDCELEASTARCEAGLTTADAPRGRSYGPSCACAHRDERCHLRWFDPVPCKTTDDCWSSDQPVAHAIRRPARLRGRKFRGCKDGEHVPSCVEGRCVLDGLRC